MIPTPRSNWFNTDRTAWVFSRFADRHTIYRKLRPVRT